VYLGIFFFVFIHRPRALVPGEFQKLQCIENILQKFIPDTCLVKVVDTQKDTGSGEAGNTTCQYERSKIANVEISGWRGGESGAFICEAVPHMV
jgi:hypothetical protein